MTTRTAVIAHTGKDLGGGLDEFRRVLHRRGIEPRWYEVPKSKKAPKHVRRALADGAELLFVWGGDGMVQRCAHEAAGTGATLAIIPTGTANLLATNLGIPKDIESAVAVALDGTRRKLDLGTINGEHFAVMAGAGFDAAMIRDADSGLKDRIGRAAYVWTGARNIRRTAVRARIKVDGEKFFEGDVSCVLAGNVGALFGGITVFPEAQPDDGSLEVAVVTATNLLEWSRVFLRTARSQPADSPFVALVPARSVRVRFDRPVPYELDGGDRPPTDRLKIDVEPLAGVGVRPGGDGMSTATPIPETWELDGDDARETLLGTGRRRLAQDAFVRMRAADGFSHARSLAFVTTLVLLEGIIGLVGLASVLGSHRFGNVVSDIVEQVVPGPAGEVLTQTVRQARTAASAGEWFGLVFGLVGALVTATTLMGQMERVSNRLYGVERDRPTKEKYTRAFVLAVTAGLAASLAFVMLTFGHGLTHDGDSVATTVWRVARWPVALGLMVAAIALLFRYAPRRHQPSWSWLAYGAGISVVGWALASVGLGLFFRWSTSFGDTYGPLAGTVGLLLWAFFTSVSIVYGASVSAQLEAVRAEGIAPPQEPPVWVATDAQQELLAAGTGGSE